MRRYFAKLLNADVAPAQAVAVGKITRGVGLTLEARGISVPLGTRCLIEDPHNAGTEVEVVGFDGDKSFLMPLKPIQSLSPGARVHPLMESVRLPAGDALLGPSARCAGLTS